MFFFYFIQYRRAYRGITPFSLQRHLERHADLDVLRLLHNVCNADRFRRSFVEVVGDEEAIRRGFDDFLGLFDVGALKPDDDGFAQADVGSSVDDARRDDVAPHDAAKNIHKDRLDLVVRVQNFERFRDLLFGRTATDVKKVGRIAVVQLDDVHGGHGQARAVDEAPNVTIKADVVEVVLGRLRLAGVFLAIIAKLKNLFLPKLVVVKVELGVANENFALASPQTG